MQTLSLKSDNPEYKGMFHSYLASRSLWPRKSRKESAVKKMSDRRGEGMADLLYFLPMVMGVITGAVHVQETMRFKRLARGLTV